MSMPSSSAQHVEERRQRDLQHAEGQDGGLPGWFAVLATWVTWFIWGSSIKTLGLLLPTLQVQFATRAWIIGWIVAIMVGALGVSGVFAGALGIRFGTGLIVVYGGVVIGGGFIFASLITDALQLAILTTCAGSALGLVNVLTREAIGICFEKNYVIASAIGQSGLPIAMIVYAPLAQLFLDTYGWRGTLMILGATVLHVVPCGQLLYITLPARQAQRYKEVATDGTEDEHKAKDQRRGLAQYCWGFAQFWISAVHSLDIKLLSSIQYWLLFAIYLGTQFTFDVWYIYFVSHAESKGFELKDAAMFITYAGVGDIVLKIAHAPLIDKGIMSLRTMLGGSIFICFVCLVLTPFISSYWAMASTACVYVSCIGVIANLIDVLMKLVLGTDRLACAFGWSGLTIGAIRITIGFFPGWMYEHSGTYDIAFVILGLMQFGALISLLLLRCTEKQ